VGVWRKKNEDNDNQLWYFHHHTGTIRTRHNDFCLDVLGNEIVMNPFDTYHTKRWTIMGNRICLEGASDQVVELADGGSSEGATLQLAEYNAEETQHWVLEFTEPHFFLIKTKLCDNILKVQNGNLHAPVIMEDETNNLTKDMVWYEDEYGYVRSGLNGYALDIDPSTLLMMMPYDENNLNQRWVIEGEYIVNRHRDDLPVVDIVGANKKNGAEVCAYQRSGSDNQRWEIEYL